MLPRDRGAISSRGSLEYEEVKKPSPKGVAQTSVTVRATQNEATALWTNAGLTLVRVTQPPHLISLVSLDSFRGKDDDKAGKVALR